MSVEGMDQCMDIFMSVPLEKKKLIINYRASTQSHDDTPVFNPRVLTA